MLTFALLFSLASCQGEMLVPDGYKLASHEDACRYYSFVPDAWIVSSGDATDFTDATISTLDPCNISLSVMEGVYAETMADYWKQHVTEYEKLFDTFTVIEEGTGVKIGAEDHQLQGYRYTFTSSFGGKEYKQMQIFFVHNGVLASQVYCFTYTSTPEHYDTHLEQINQILAYFYFK